jgi:DNA repair protein RadD
MMVLRPYQEAAVDAIVSASLTDRFILLQLSTGGGKTIIFSELIRRWLQEYRMRILVLAHRKELIEQAADKLRKVWPKAPIGIACASVSSHADLFQPVVIGSVQTVTNRLGKCPPFHLVIIDEAHRLPPRNKESQYRTLITKMEEYYPQLRVLGVTATPYRLGHGYIYGSRCRPGATNWFNKLHFSIRLSDLQEQGYLVPMRAKETVDIDGELRRIRTSGGDWNLGDLSELMSRERHVGSAVHAYREYGEGRWHVVVFCVTIAHAERVRDAFRAAGYDAECVHSEMPMDERARILEAFDAGRLHILCNVGVLTEGWDCTRVDCILLCRPTKSPGLHIQIIGRGLRPHPGKTDLLVLDLSGNMRRHGDLDSPDVSIPKASGNGNDREPVTAPMKTCPACREILPASTMECPECGHLWEPEPVNEINDPVRMREIKFGPWSMDILSVTPRYHISRAGNPMLKLIISARDKDGGFIPKMFYHFWDIEGRASEYGRQKASAAWKRFGGRDPIPETIQDAIRRFDELAFPTDVIVKQNGKYLNVVGW